jgi:hypothetical protein
VDTRRSFLTGLVVMGTVTVLTVVATRAQAPEVPLSPRASQDKSGAPVAPPESPNLPSADKRMLEANEKEIKKKVERLYELATELKAEVDKTDSSKVLSLTLLKKTEEIEKLARDIRSRSKG